MVDYRESEGGRRQTWHGAKKPVKRFLSLRLPHALLRAALRVLPSLRSGRLPAPRSLKEVRGAALGFSFVMLRPDACEVAKELYWGKGKRPNAADNYAIELFARMSRNVDVILDVGAYTGIFTIVGVLSNPRVEAHAFEIIPDVFKLLVDNCVRNDILHRVTCYHVGLGAPDRIAIFPSESPGSALPSFYSSRLSFASGVRVRFRSLDWVGQFIHPGNKVLMKIDVEGTENDIFRAGKAFLSEFKPDILCEVLEDVADGPELADLLAPYGYRHRLIRDGGLAEESDIKPTREFRDWLFTTKDTAELEALGLRA